MLSGTMNGKSDSTRPHTTFHLQTTPNSPMDLHPPTRFWEIEELPRKKMLTPSYPVLGNRRVAAKEDAYTRRREVWRDISTNDDTRWDWTIHSDPTIQQRSETTVRELSTFLNSSQWSDHRASHPTSRVVMQPSFRKLWTWDISNLSHQLNRINRLIKFFTSLSTALLKGQKAPPQSVEWFLTQVRSQVVSQETTLS